MLFVLGKDLFIYIVISCQYCWNFEELYLFYKCGFVVIIRKEHWDFRKSKEEGNTGYYFVKSNNKTIKLWQAAFEAVPK